LKMAASQEMIARSSGVEPLTAAEAQWDG
jgi:hypothetical protein